MSPHIERIYYVEADLRRFQEGNFREVESSELLMGVLQELLKLDSVERLDMLSELKREAPELHDIVKNVIENFDLEMARLQISAVGHGVKFHADGRAIVDLDIYHFGESANRCSADLEDLIWLTGRITEVVALSMESAQSQLSAAAMRANVENFFSKNLKELEEQTARVRDLYEEISKES